MTDDSSKDLNAGHGGDLAMTAASRRSKAVNEMVVIALARSHRWLPDGKCNDNNNKCHKNGASDSSSDSNDYVLMHALVTEQQIWRVATGSNKNAVATKILHRSICTN